MLIAMLLRRLPRPFTLVMPAVVALSFVLSAAPASAQSASAQGTVRDKAFWQGVIKNDFKAPPDVPLLILLGELNMMLGSPDPELRDDIAYSVLGNWIYRQRIVPVEERLRLLRSWQDTLKAGIGQQGNDTVVLRSFSALSLGVLAILDNEAPYLDRAAFSTLLASSLAYLKDEQDVRGFGRADFDEAGFATWLKTMAPIRQTAAPTLAALATGQNRKNVLVSLFAVLSTDRRDLGGVTRARTMVLETLKGFL